MAWFYLFLAGGLEVGFTTFLKLSDGFKNLWHTAGFLIFSALSFLCLSKSLSEIPIGTSYAVWTGIGAAGTAVIGILFFSDSVSFWRVFFLVLLIFSTIGLKLVSDH